MTNTSLIQLSDNTKQMIQKTPAKKTTVTLTIDAYNFLVSQGRKNETFSDIVLSLRDRLK